MAINQQALSALMSMLGGGVGSGGRPSGVNALAGLGLGPQAGGPQQGRGAPGGGPQQGRGGLPGGLGQLLQQGQQNPQGSGGLLALQQSLGLPAQGNKFASRLPGVPTGARGQLVKQHLGGVAQAQGRTPPPPQAQQKNPLELMAQLGGMMSFMQLAGGGAGGGQGDQAAREGVQKAQGVRDKQKSRVADLEAQQAPPAALVDSGVLPGETSDTVLRGEDKKSADVGGGSPLAAAGIAAGSSLLGDVFGGDGGEDEAREQRHLQDRLARNNRFLEVGRMMQQRNRDLQNILTSLATRRR